MIDNPKNIDRYKCHVYGRFLEYWSIEHTNYLFWGLFVLDIVFLIIAGSCWERAHRHQEVYKQLAHRFFHNQHDSALHEKVKAAGKKAADSTDICIIASSLCTSASIPSVVVEALAGLAIAFCHQEDLIFFYWGSFFLLSVGSFIATFGLFYFVAFQPTVPWNVGFGTPVLVFGGCGSFVVLNFGRWIWKKVAGQEPEVDEEKLSEGEKQARHLAAFCPLLDCCHSMVATPFEVTSAPGPMAMLQFMTDGKTHVGNAHVLGKTLDGRTVLQYELQPLMVPEPSSASQSASLASTVTLDPA